MFFEAAESVVICSSSYGKRLRHPYRARLREKQKDTVFGEQKGEKLERWMWPLETCYRGDRRGRRGALDVVTALAGRKDAGQTEGSEL